MLVCAAQYHIEYENKQANMATCERLCAQASKNHAELIVFPELSLTGFSLKESLSEENGMTAEFFQELAVKYNIACVYGFAERNADRIFNTLCVSTPDGSILAKYAKMHPFSVVGEDKVFTAGDKVSAFSYKEIKFGLSVCYDLRFPELYRALSKNCECLIVSANWAASRIDHWSALLKARAIENQCYVIGCNCICKKGMQCGGCSAIIHPDGTEITVTNDEEALIYADVSADIVHNMRCSFPVSDDRRPDIYRNFYE